MSTKPGRRPVARFFNTVEPVISLFRAVGERLLAEGYDVEIVVTGAEYRIGGTALADWAAATGVRMVAVPGVSSYPRGGFGKALVSAYYSVFATLYALFARPSSVNIFLTQPPLFFAVGRLVRFIRGQPYACITMDIYPDVLVAFGKLRSSGPVHHVMQGISFGALRRADAVVSIGRCMSRLLEARGVRGEKIHLIPNWAEPWLSAAGGTGQGFPRPALAELGLHQKTVLLYSGNMGAAHTFDELLGAANQLRRDDRIRFLIVGEGVRRDAVRSRVERDRLDNVVMLPYQDRTRAAQLMKEADAHLVTQREGFEGLVVPSKAYSALGVGRPLVYVGRPDGEIASMIREEAVGFVIPVGDSGGLADACRTLADDAESTAAMARRAALLASGRYGRDRASEQYVTMIGRLADPEASEPGRDADGKPD